MSEHLPVRRLSSAEVDRVLRRAVELQQRAADPEPSYSLSDVERLGSEIGVSPEAIAAALAQLQHEALARPHRSPQVLDRAFGPAWVVAARTVPGPARDVMRATSTMLYDQLFRVYRNLGATVVWSPNAGLLDGMRRTLDVSDRYRLLADVVVVTVTESMHGPGCCDVRIEAGLPHRRSATLRRVVASSLLLGGGATAIATTMSGVLWPLLAAGLVLATLAAVRTRTRYRAQASQLQQVVERFLDYLERER